VPAFGTIQHLEAVGVDLYLDQQSIDTTTPMGKLVFQVTGAFAEFERSMIRQRIKAGLKRAVAQGAKPDTLSPFPRYRRLRAFATWRACWMKSCATGLSVRFLRVATPVGMRASGSLTGNILSSLRLVGNLNMEAGIIVRNRPVVTRLIPIAEGTVNTAALG
jgi:hypothetical protein